MAFIITSKTDNHNAIGMSTFFNLENYMIMATIENFERLENPLYEELFDINTDEQALAAPSRKFDTGPSRKFDTGPSTKFDNGPSRKFDGSISSIDISGETQATLVYKELGVQIEVDDKARTARVIEL